MRHWFLNPWVSNGLSHGTLFLGNKLFQALDPEVSRQDII